MDSFSGINSDPPSLHKYLYGRVNPINRVDPSGNFTLTEQIAIAPIWANIALIGIAGGLSATHVYNRYFAGDPPTPTQAAKLLRAINLVAAAGSNGKYTEFADRASKLTVRVRDLAPDKFGRTPYMAYRTIWLERLSFEYDDKLFAALLLHETAHTLQRVWFTRHWREDEAYQIESDFLRDVGVSGTIGSLIDKYPNAHDFLVDERDRFAEENVKEPAITPQ